MPPPAAPAPAPPQASEQYIQPSTPVSRPQSKAGMYISGATGVAIPGNSDIDTGYELNAARGYDARKYGTPRRSLWSWITCAWLALRDLCAGKSKSIAGSIRICLHAEARQLVEHGRDRVASLVRTVSESTNRAYLRSETGSLSMAARTQ